jgi:hypothetical protein
MSTFTSSGMKSSVCAAAAVLVTALIPLSFAGYINYLERHAPPSATTIQADSGTPATDRDVRNG